MILIHNGDFYVLCLRLTTKHLPYLTMSVIFHHVAFMDPFVHGKVFLPHTNTLGTVDGLLSSSQINQITSLNPLYHSR